MAQWYEFNPSDTLFFKGPEPLEKGSGHRTKLLFPPSRDTITGAIRTAYLKQKGIPFVEYIQEGFDKSEVIRNIGKAGEAAPWTVIGPIIRKNGTIYIPAPYTWFVDKEEYTNRTDKQQDHELVVYKAKPISNPIINVHSIQKPLWVRSGKGELTNLGGKWIPNEALHKETVKSILENKDIYMAEPRTGIEIDYEKGTVKEHHLFTMSHIRLLEGVSLVFGVTQDIDISDNGILMLGGEQRFGKYERLEIDLRDSDKREGLFLSLSSVDAKQKNISKNVIATGKIEYRGGWDMKKWFHKPLRGYYPAGTVFSSNILGNSLFMEEK